MKIQNMYNSFIFRFFEGLYHLVLVNMLFILTFIAGLGLFSYLPAMVILVLAIKSRNEATEYSLVKTWMKNVKAHGWTVFKLSLFFTGVSLIAAFDTMYFYLLMQEEATLYYEVLFYVFLVIDVLVFVTIINAAFVYVYFPHLGYKKIIKHSFGLLRLIPLEALIVIVGLLLGITFFYVFPFALVFIWFSLVFSIFHKAVRKKYERLMSEEVRPRSFTDVY